MRRPSGEVPNASGGSPSAATLRAFVRRTTRLLPLPDVPNLRLYQADDISVLWQRVGTLLGDPDPPMPFWAFAWAGGLAVARYLLDHPEEVRARRVLDLASGSGLCGLVALCCGAAVVDAVDIDALAEAAVAVNARANGVRIGFRRGDLLGGPVPPAEVILAGDICYEQPMAARMLPWLAGAAERGARVLIGDPGRAYLPSGLERLALYHVRTSREIESSELREAAVFTVPFEAHRSVMRTGTDISVGVPRR